MRGNATGELEQPRDDGDEDGNGKIGKLQIFKIGETKTRNV